MNTKKKTKSLLYRIITKPSGRRFLYAYSKINQSINHSIFLKISLSVIGIGLVFIGIISLFTPGPGILLILIGGALLSVVSKRIAILLDRLEKRVKALYKKK